METFKIKGGKNPEYRILRTEAMLESTATKAIQTGKEPILYFMQGITRTGKTSTECFMCYRFNSGKFIIAL